MNEDAAALRETETNRGRAAAMGILIVKAICTILEVPNREEDNGKKKKKTFPTTRVVESETTNNNYQKKKAQ